MEGGLYATITGSNYNEFFKGGAPTEEAKAAYNYIMEVSNNPTY